MSQKPILLTDTTALCLKPGLTKVFDVWSKGSQFSWKQDGVPQKSDSLQYVFEPTAKGVYTLTFSQAYEFRDPVIASKMCFGPDLTFTQEVKVVPIVNVFGDSLICENTSKVPYAITPTDPTNSFDWTVSGGRVIYKVSKGKNEDLTRQIDWTVPGLDTIAVSEYNGACYGYDRLIVSVSPHAKPNFNWEVLPSKPDVQFYNITENPIITDGDSTIVVPFTLFRWNFGHDPDTAVDQSNEAYQQDDNRVTSRYKYGYYNVKLTSINDYCKDTIVKQIFVDMQEALYVPNSFAPESNSPGLNSFRPKGFNLASYKIWIYDTWGNLIWYSDKLINGSPLEGWDGTYNGVTLKTDSYIWKIEASFLDGTTWKGQASSKNDTKSTFGNVLLLR